MWSFVCFILTLLGTTFAPSPFSRNYKGPYPGGFAGGFSTLGDFGPFGSSSSFASQSSTTPTFFLGSTNKPSSGIKGTNRYNIFDTVYEWNILDYAFDSPEQREKAIMTGEFVPENNLPLGIDRWKNT